MDYKRSNKFINDWSTILFTIIIITTLAFVIYMLLYYKFDSKIKTDYERMALKLYDGPLSALLNGSGINNIPRLNISTTNPEITKANNCSKGPVHIGDGSGTDDDCRRTCMDDSAKVVNVADGETVAYDNTILQKGAHCILGERPECNMRTSMALMTVNSVVCQSKFPRLVGGKLGNTVIACNNVHINDPQNILWDFKTNTRFNPHTTTILHEDEKLPDGSYRFACHFNGEDSRRNRYMEHPFDRFHPMENYCANLIYRADNDVRTVWSADRKTFTCDCGDPDKTRVRHLYEDDPTSQCSNVVSRLEIDKRDRKVLHLPYPCFTIFSRLDDAGIYLPCPNEQLTREGSQMSAVQIEITENRWALIEHPLYEDLNDDAAGGVDVREGMLIY